jgi:signal transduction histidine kinase
MMDPAPGSSVSVLIVEDENIVALDMKYRLENLGYAVCCIVATGESAIAESRARKPDLVLMDIQLKGVMDGVEAASQIRRESEIPIVFVTAYADDATLDRVKLAGAYGYIVKPYHEREIRITIELALSKYRYEKDLRIAKELAEASDKAKSTFLSNVSHELKTPLNSIIGFVDLAAALAHGEELKEYISLAARGARRLETLINSILDYTKLESSALAPMYDEFDLDQFLLSCWEPFAYDARAKGLDARLYVDPDLPRIIRSDSGKLGTLVRNLLDNAVKFTDAGHVLVSADLDTGLNGISVMRLSIKDTGMGIPDEKRLRMFEHFSQGDNSTTRAFGGLGLGLSLAKALSDLLGVQLAYAPGDGRGSEFSITIELPPGFTTAYPLEKNGSIVSTVGLFQAGSSAIELGRWAPRLGIRLMEIDETRVDFDGYEVLIANEEAWQHAEIGFRKAALEGNNRRLILLGGPSTRELTCLDSGLTRLQYPPSLATLALALERSREPARIQSAAIDPAVGYGRRLEDHNNRDYSRLYSAAEVEAKSKNIKTELDAFVADIGTGLARENDSALERIMKKYHDGFADAGALECAKLALAISINVRKVGAKAMAERLSTIFDRRE